MAQQRPLRVICGGVKKLSSSSCWSISFHHILINLQPHLEACFWKAILCKWWFICSFLSPFREQILTSAGMVTVSSCVPTSRVLFPVPVTAASSWTQRAGLVKVNTHSRAPTRPRCIAGLTHRCCPSRCERVSGSALQPQLLQHLRLLHMQLRGRIWADVWWHILHRWDRRTTCFCCFLFWVTFLNEPSEPGGVSNAWWLQESKPRPQVLPVTVRYLYLTVYLHKTQRDYCACVIIHYFCWHIEFKGRV